MPTDTKPTDALTAAQSELRRREAAWRRQRAEVARLFADGEDEAAEKLVGASAVGGKQAASTDATTATPPTKLPRPKTRPPVRLRRRRPTARRRFSTTTWRDWLSQRPRLLSAATHLLLLAVLALATFATLADPPVFLNVSLDEGEWADESVAVELVSYSAPAEAEETADTSALLTAEDLLAPAELELPEAAKMLDTTPLGVGELLAAVVDPGGGARTADDAGDGAATEASGASTGGASSSPPGKVRFFGTEAVANRVVFVVDNSGSMQHGRMETTLAELDRAIQRLSYSQSFYVCLFSDQAYPMFFPEPTHELLPATRENKKRLSRWLRTVEMCLGGRLLDAVEMAAALEPEVVYLLTDGDIRSPRVMGELTDPDAWPFPIHTLGMGARDRNDAGKLVAIAEAQGGGYKFVDALPASVARSRRKPIPYNREPGLVWGSAVRPWK